MAAMDPTRQKRLVQLLGMLGSEHDGEVLYAARAAQRLLGALALTWEEALGGDGGYTQAFVTEVAAAAYAQGLSDGLAKGRPKPRRLTFTGYATLVLREHRPALTDWELGFCESWAARRRGSAPSEKEQAIFRRLAAKLGEPIPAEAWAEVG